MNCRGAFRRLSAYIDSALSPGIRRAVDEHLQGCPSCRKKLAEFKAISNAAGNLPPLEVSEGFADGVMNTVKDHEKTREVIGNIRYRLTFASAAFTVAAIAIFFVFGPAPTDLTVAQAPETIQEALETPDTPSLDDMADHLRMVVFTVPVPDSILQRDRELDREMILADSLSAIDNFEFPGIGNAKEDVSVRF